MLDITMDRQSKRENEHHKNDNEFNENACRSQQIKVCKLIQASAKGLNAIGEGLSKQYDEQ